MPQIISKDSSLPAELPRQSYHAHNKCILMSALLMLIGVVIGFYLAGAISRSIQDPDMSAVKKGSYQDGYQTALDFARVKLREKGMFFGMGQMSSIPSATVKSVSGNSIVVEFEASLLDFFAEGKSTKTIKVPEGVNIQQNTPKEFDEYQKEEVAFRKKMDEMQARQEAGGAIDMDFPAPPMPYTIKQLKLSDLKAGDLISVVFTGDISKSDALEATDIMMTYLPADIPGPGADVELVMPSPPEYTETEIPMADSDLAIPEESEDVMDDAFGEDDVRPAGDGIEEVFNGEDPEEVKDSEEPEISEE